MQNRVPGILRVLVCSGVFATLTACALTTSTVVQKQVVPAPAASAPAASQSATAPPPKTGKAGTAQQNSSAASRVQGNLKPYAALIKDFKRVPGYLTVYQKDEQYLLELKPGDFDKPFLFTIRRSQGIGERGIWGNMLLESGVGRFMRYSNRVQWIEHNTAFKAPNNPPLQDAIADSFSDSLRGSTPIVSQPEPTTKAILVDLNALALTDFTGTTHLLQSIFRQPYQFDRNNSVIERVHVTKEETDIAIRTHYAGALMIAPPGQNPAALVPGNLPDPRSMFIGIGLGFSALPTPMRPRQADSRVGYLTTVQRNFDNDLGASNHEFLINRWRLEKKDPDAPLSAPVKPITYWLDRNIPLRYRDAVKRGILAWNDVFERIGFKNAIVVRQQPDDPNWQPPDSRHATVKWFLGTDNNVAMGQSLVDWRTGEILEANVIIPDLWTRGPRHIAVHDVLSGNTDNDSDCMYADEAFVQMQQALDLLVARNDIAPDGPEAEAFVQDALASVVTHEVGHTLGLSHNFRASSAYSLTQLQDPAFVAKNGIATSVMDYLPYNVPLKGQKPTEYVQKRPGHYDYWAIEYGYKPLAADNESAALREIAMRAASDPYLAFGNDGDAGSLDGSVLSTGIDPAVARFDLGDDPVAWLQRSQQLAQALWQDLAKKTPDGSATEDADARRSVERSLTLVGLAAANAARNIGGISVIRHTSPAHRAVFTPIPAATQRNTLGVLSRGLFEPTSFQLDPALLRRLSASPLETSSLEPQFPLLTRVQQIQSQVLDLLFSDRVSNRLLETELIAGRQDNFHLAELYTKLRQSIWSELDSGTNIPLMRRNLQRAYLARLNGLLLQTRPTTPADARSLARHEATTLQAHLRQAVDRKGRNTETLAHLRESLTSLDEALRAPVLRQSP